MPGSAPHTPRRPLLPPLAPTSRSAPETRAPSPWKDCAAPRRPRKPPPIFLHKTPARKPELSRLERMAAEQDFEGGVRGLALKLPPSLKGGIIAMPVSPLDIAAVRQQLKSDLLPKQYVRPARNPLRAQQTLTPILNAHEERANEAAWHRCRHHFAPALARAAPNNISMKAKRPFAVASSARPPSLAAKENVH